MPETPYTREKGEHPCVHLFLNIELKLNADFLTEIQRLNFNR